MSLPLSMSNISLWLAATALILLISSELLYSIPEISARIMIDQKRLRLASLGCGLSFLITVVMRIYQPF